MEQKAQNYEIVPSVEGLQNLSVKYWLDVNVGYEALIGTYWDMEPCVFEVQIMAKQASYKIRAEKEKKGGEQYVQGETVDESQGYGQLVMGESIVVLPPDPWQLPHAEIKNPYKN